MVKCFASLCSWSSKLQGSPVKAVGYGNLNSLVRQPKTWYPTGAGSHRIPWQARSSWHCGAIWIKATAMASHHLHLTTLFARIEVRPSIMVLASLPCTHLSSSSYWEAEHCPRGNGLWTHERSRQRSLHEAPGNCSGKVGPPSPRQCAKLLAAPGHSQMTNRHSKPLPDMAQLDPSELRRLDPSLAPFQKLFPSSSELPTLLLLHGLQSTNVSRRCQRIQMYQMASRFPSTHTS